jgi:hypothetical protein
LTKKLNYLGGYQMLDYKRFYHEHGARFIRDLLNPLVWSSDIIVFPKGSMLFWNNATSTKVYPSKEYSYFKNMKKAFVFTITDYASIDILGNPKPKTFSIAKYMRAGKLAEPKYKYVKEIKSPVPVNIPIIFSLGVLNASYKYMPHPLTNYNVWHNSFSRTADLATIKRSGANRHKFIIINLPHMIPSLAMIRKYSGIPTRNMLNVFTDHTFFNILELFRFVNKTNRELSILANTLSEDEFKYVDIVLTINDKVSIINLGLLASITDAYDITSKLTKYKSNIVIKALYIYLNKILEAAPMLSKNSNLKPNLSGAVNNSIALSDSLDIVNLDHVIEDDIAAKELNPENVINVVNSMADTADAETSISANLDDQTHVEITSVNTGEDLTDHTKLIAVVDRLKDSKVISKSGRDTITTILKEQAKKRSPYEDGSTLSEMLTYSKDEITLDSDSVAVSDSSSVLDKSMNRNSLKTINDTYRKKTMRKDILSTMYSIQKAGIIIKDHEVTEHNDALGSYEMHKLTLRALDGAASTIRIKLPIVNDDNTVSMNGNRYTMRKQIADIPIKKISNSVVSLNSYFGKLFISRASFKKDDLGYWFQKQLLKMYEVDKDLKDIALVSVVSEEAGVPKHYGMLSRYIKGFRYKGIIFNFDYNSRERVFNKIDVSKAERKGVLVGSKSNIPVVMDKDNNILLLDKTTVNLGTIFDVLGLDESKAPIEFCTAKIYKEQLPLGMLLSYYLGFTNLLKFLKVKYTKIDAKKRVTLEPNQYKLVFQDVTYVIDRDYDKADLIISGLASIKKYIKLINSDTLDSKTKFTAIYAAMQLPLLYINEIKLINDMFIDPITKQVLELYKQPTTFVGILITAAELLTDDNYNNPKNMEGSVIKGYERISGMMYLELVRSIRLTNNRSHFSKSKMSINPYAVMTAISTDNTTVLVDDINPIASLKQMEDVTYLGSHGRKEETMSVPTRVMHESEVGVMSEAVKDSGAVGISVYLTADPKITTTRGTTGKLTTNDGWSSKLSTSGMLAPFGTTDDPKRLSFASVQNSHVVPMSGMHAPYVRTGYESVVAVRADDKFVVSATESGEVISVSKDTITVNYKKSGKKKYSLREWTSKEEAGVSYTHKVVPNFKKGDKFSKDDSLAYDSAFFEPDIFNTNRVIYRQGGSLTIALMEAPETYEDSGAISRKAAATMSTIVTKVKTITVINTDSVLKPVNVGDKTEPSTPILSIVDAELGQLGDLDDKALEILQGLKMLSPKAGYRGKVSKIRVYYNCEYNDLSPTLKKLAKISDAELTNETGYTGAVDSGYTIKGKPLQENEVAIKYYIKVPTAMGTGDKAILGNQLKFTIGEVMEEPMVAEDGTEIDGLFSSMSIEARIVNSPALLGTTSKLLEVLTDKVVDEYFN